MSKEQSFDAMQFVREQLVDIDFSKWLKLLRFLATYDHKEHGYHFEFVFDYVKGKMGSVPRHLRTFVISQRGLAVVQYSEDNTPNVGKFNDLHTKELLYFADLFIIDYVGRSNDLKKMEKYMGQCMVKVYIENGFISEYQKLILKLAKAGKLNGLYQLEMCHLEGLTDADLEMIFSGITRLCLAAFTEEDIKKLPIRWEQITALRFEDTEWGAIEYAEAVDAPQSIYRHFEAVHLGEDGMHASATATYIGVNRIVDGAIINIIEEDCDDLLSEETSPEPYKFPKLKSIQIESDAIHRMSDLFISGKFPTPSMVFIEDQGGSISCFDHINPFPIDPSVIKFFRSFLRTIEYFIENGVKTISIPHQFYQDVKWICDKLNVTLLVNVPQFIYLS